MIYFGQLRFEIWISYPNFTLGQQPGISYLMYTQYTYILGESRSKAHTLTKNHKVDKCHNNDFEIVEFN